MMLNLSLFVTFLYCLTDAHGTEMRPAHGAITTAHVVRLLVIFQSSVRVERQVELVFPPKLIARLA